MPDMDRLKWYGVLAIGVSFSAGGFWMVATGAEHGWAIFLFFALCAAVAVSELWPGILRRETASADVMLERFPGPVVLRVAQLKHLFMLVGVAVFGGVSLYAVIHADFDWFETAVMWLCIALIVGSVPFIVLIMIKGSSLRLDAEGLRINQSWRSHLVRWKETSTFEVSTFAIAMSAASMTLVVFDDAASSGSKLAPANTSLTGRNSGLPDTYGYSHEDLAWLLNRWRDRALAQS